MVTFQVKCITSDKDSTSLVGFFLFSRKIISHLLWLPEPLTLPSPLIGQGLKSDLF